MSHNIAGTMRATSDERNVSRIVDCLEANDKALLAHTYFQLCETGQLGRQRMLDVVRQLYCFSIFFERILTRRIAEYSNQRDQRVVKIARTHLRDEIGHAELFRQCLLDNGVSEEQVAQIAPKMFTKALFGYLLATVAHENEYVSNVAIMQVMETIGYHFFNATLEVMRRHGMLAAAFVAHAEDDAEHRHLGMDLAVAFDDRTMVDSLRIINDVYRLMHFVLDEWLDLPRADGMTFDEPLRPLVSHVTDLRPPRLGPLPEPSPASVHLPGAREEQIERSVYSFRREGVGAGVHLAHVTLVQGQSSTLHSHTVTSDTFYVMSGVLTVTVHVDGSAEEAYYCARCDGPEVEVVEDGRSVHTIRVRAGHILNISPGVPHCTSNEDADLCQFLCIEGIGVYDFVSCASRSSW